MSLSGKQKLSFIPFILYWPILFTLMHIPIPNSGKWQVTISISDKILHCMAYLILVFVVWFALKQDAKVNWRKSLPWLIILGVAIYGIFDEWLQGYVGRSSDITDFAADVIAAILGLAVLTYISFWTASLIITAIAIFILSQFLKINFSAQLPILVTGCYILFFSFFTLLWIKCVENIKNPAVWKTALFAGPLIFLLIVELCFKFANYEFSKLNTCLAAVAISTINLVYYKHRDFFKNIF